MGALLMRLGLSLAPGALDPAKVTLASLVDVVPIVIGVVPPIVAAVVPKSTSGSGT